MTIATPQPLSPWPSERTSERAAYAASSVLVAALVVGLLACPELVTNSLHDAWWHIAATDEYARTGVFAKDPFYQDAPRFAQFGLMDFVAGQLSRSLGFAATTTVPAFIACGVGVFFVYCFLCGYILGGRAVSGCIFALVSITQYPAYIIPNLGEPFKVATAGFWLFLLVLLGPARRLRTGADPPHGWVAGLGSYREAEGIGAAWRAALLAVIFCLHAFSGLVGLAVAGVVISLDVIGASFGNRTVPRHHWHKAILFSAVFGALAWPWLWLHAELRPLLDTFNAHDLGTSVPFPISLSLAVLVTGTALVDHNAELERRSVIWGVLCYGAALLILCIPALNLAVASHTSSFMAHRLPGMFPLGAAAVITWLRVEPVLRRQKMLTLRDMAIVIVTLVVIVLPALGFARANLWRLRHYGRLEHTYLEKDLGERFEWRLIVGDPYTSYFARGMSRVYAVAVPSGHASPAVDYEARLAVLKEIMLGGPTALTRTGLTAAGVVIDKRSRLSMSFYASLPLDRQAIVSVWEKGGWRITAETPDMWLLEPAPSRRVTTSSSGCKGRVPES